MTLRKGCGGVFHTMAAYKHIFVRNRLLHFVLVSFLPCQAAPNTVWAQAKAGTSALTVSVTPVSHDSETIGGEPELDLSTPDPEVSSVLYLSSRHCISMDDSYCASSCLRPRRYFNGRVSDGSYRSFHPGQGFLQCRSKWHAAEITGSQSMRSLAVFFAAKAYPMCSIQHLGL